ncbi:MAG: DUF434 domain-containing protein [Deltaproteobacteria bacterium]|nr:DUF434 domain-containing protein [Deltaproteobacteria bacterium]
MTDRRTHRGPGPQDLALFAPGALGALRAAVAELSWLLSHGYRDASALKLVGDRHALTQRQRVAVGRCACSDAALARRAVSRLSPEALHGRGVVVDGFNCLITLETALSGGLLLLGRDGCTRDLGSVHGSYRAVEETERAISLVGEWLTGRGASRVCWLLDRPVSNSGRLRARLLEQAAAQAWPWTVELLANPDRTLAASSDVVASADSWVLDRCSAWVDLTGEVVARCCPEAWRPALVATGGSS